MRPAGSAKTLERRRLRAITLREIGRFPVDVARELGVDRRSVRRWRAAFERQGAKGLGSKPSPGRPPKLDGESRKRLESYLTEGALAMGYSSDLWTCPRVAELVRKKFRVRYHVDHIGRLLRGMGWTPQKPKRRARERDEEAIQGWVKEAWPRLKKTPRG